MYPTQSPSQLLVSPSCQVLRSNTQELSLTPLFTIFNQPTNPHRVIKCLGLLRIEGFTERIFRVKTRTTAGKARQLFTLDDLLPILSLRSFPSKLSLTHPTPMSLGSLLSVKHVKYFSTLRPWYQLPCCLECYFKLLTPSSPRSLLKCLLPNGSSLTIQLNTASPFPYLSESTLLSWALSISNWHNLFGRKHWDNFIM